MDLREKAKKLGIEVSDEMTDEEIQKLIDEKEEELKKKEKDPAYLEEELKKVIAQRDSIKKERRTLQNKISEFEKKLKEAPSADEITAMREEFEALKEFKTTVEKEKEEKDLANKTELERKEIEFKKQMEDLQAQFDKNIKDLTSKVEESQEEIKKRESKIASLRTYRLEREIIENASQKAYNPKQVVTLLKNGFEYDDNLDKFYHPVYDQSGKMINEMTVDEYVKEFLDAPENDNLVKSDANTDSLHTKKTVNTNVTHTGVYNPKDPEIIKEAEEHNLSPEAWAEIAEKRDIKLGKIKKE